jgi:hypothetical protein
MRQTVTRIAAGCAGVILVLLAATWLFGGFTGMSLAGDIALTLGITVTVGLGIGLMALVFYSSRSERDEAVHRSTGGNGRA